MSVLDWIRFILAILVIAGFPSALLLWVAIHPFAAFWRRIEAAFSMRGFEMSNRFRNALVVPVIVALFAMAFVVPHAPGQDASAPPAAASDRFAAARAAIARLLKEKSASGIAVAVAKDGKIVWEEGFGFTAHTSGAPVTPDTRFSLASITKALTAAGLMILVERGLIGLDKPANEYLGQAKLRAVVEEGPPATVRNLVFHMSGLPMHYHLFYADGAARPPVMDASIRRYGLLAAPPGEAYDYSNFGYGILGHILARVSGQSYAEYMDTAVFQPLGLRRTAILTEAGRSDGAAAKYSAGKRELPFCDFDHQGASAAYASAHDLVRFGMFHLGERAADQKQILSAATLAAMHSRSESSFLDGSRLVKYLLGSFAQIDFMGRQFHSVTGSMPGAVSRLDLLPSEHIASAVLANGDDIDLWTLQNAIFNALLSKPLELPAAPSPAPEAAAGARFSPPELLLGRWAGTVRAGDKDLPAALSFRRGGSHTRVNTLYAARPFLSGGNVVRNLPS